MATQEESDKLLQELTEDHSDLEPIEASSDDKDNGAGGDHSDDKSDDAPAGDKDDSDKEDSDRTDDAADDEDGSDDSEDGADADKSDDSEDADAERVGKKKDASSRIQQLVQEKKDLEEQKRQLEEKYSKKIAEEQKQQDLADDPIYKLEDFIGTLGEDGEVLSDAEAKARFQAWEADKKLRDYQKGQVMKEQAETLVKLQSETKEAFEKFPEFNQNSDKYDKDLAEIANEAFSAGLIFATGHEGDNNYIIGSRINPGQLLEKLHNKWVQQEKPVTKVNDLGDGGGSVISTRQVTKKTEKYAPGFQGEVEKELDKLIKAKKEG